MSKKLPLSVKRCVYEVVKERGKGVREAFGICVSTYQKNGTLEPGSLRLTEKGKVLEREHREREKREPKLKGYKELLRKERERSISECKEVSGDELIELVIMQEELEEWLKGE